LRRRLFSASRTERADLEPALAVSRVERTVSESAPPGMEFFQYAFTEAEFTRRLEEAGFVVDGTFGYGLIWGLLELPRFQKLYRSAFAAASGLRQRLRGAAASSSSTPSVPAPAPAPSTREPGVASWLRRALIKEDRATPLLGPLVGAMCEYFSNMRMYVARPRT
jgi:hypothetical protein